MSMCVTSSVSRSCSRRWISKLTYKHIQVKPAPRLSIPDKFRSTY